MDKVRKIDSEIKKIHKDIKKSNLILRQRMRDIQQDLQEWNILGDINEEGKGFLHQK